MANTKADLSTKLQDQLRFEALISDLSARFVKLSTDDVDSEIELAMQMMMAFFHGDRCGMIEVHPQKIHTRITHVCQAEGIERVSVNINLAALYPWHYKKLSIEKQPVSITCLSELPPEAEVDRQSAIAMGIQSLLTVPVFIRERVVYYIGVQSLRSKQVWPEEYIPRLRLIGEIFVGALARRDADRILTGQFNFEKILSDLSTRFISLPAEHIDDAIEEAQRIIAQHLDVERCAIFLKSHADKDYVISHSWNDPQWPPLAKIYAARNYPWELRELSNGRIVQFASISELPPEAAQDAATHRNLGLKSHIALPLSTGDSLFGALAFGSLLEERVWTEDLINRLRLLAEIFSNALARKQAEEQLQERIREIEKLKEQLEKDNVYLREEVKLLFEHEEIVGESDAIRHVLGQAEGQRDACHFQRPLIALRRTTYSSRYWQYTTIGCGNC